MCVWLIPARFIPVCLTDPGTIYPGDVTDPATVGSQCVWLIPAQFILSQTRFFKDTSVVVTPLFYAVYVWIKCANSRSVIMSGELQLYGLIRNRLIGLFTSCRRVVVIMIIGCCWGFVGGGGGYTVHTLNKPRRGGAVCRFCFTNFGQRYPILGE